MSSYPLSRRSFLGGVGGAAVGLPLLDLMTAQTRASFAATPPSRYLVCFVGSSLGAEDDPDIDYVPSIVGPGYELKTPFVHFADYAVENEITVVTGLKVPWAQGGQIPAGGRPIGFHIVNYGPQICGVRSTEGNDIWNDVVRGPTSDQIVADAIGNDTIFKLLNYRVQASYYSPDGNQKWKEALSYKDDGSGGVLPVPPTVSPKQAFDSLFYNFGSPTDPAEQAERDYRWRVRKSVLDLVRGDGERLVATLGGEDKRRLERHLDEIRDLEKRIATLPPLPSGACEQLPDPGADPPVGGDQGTLNDLRNYQINLGYSNEEERARVFCDLVHMAFTCDMARVGALMLSMPQSYLNMYELTGLRTDVHGASHGVEKNPDQSYNFLSSIQSNRVLAWHYKHFAYLVGKLRDTPEAGGSVLDHCGMVLLHEGGHGYDPSSSKNNASHSSENMACLVAGGAGGLKRGIHLPAPNAHPAQVVLTVMNAVGVSSSALGEVTGTVAGLVA